MQQEDIIIYIIEIFSNNSLIIPEHKQMSSSSIEPTKLDFLTSREAPDISGLALNVSKYICICKVLSAERKA